MWNRNQKVNRPYTVAKDFHGNTPVELDLAHLTFYSKHEDGSVGWAISPDDATPLALTEAETVVSERGGVILLLRECQEYKTEYLREKLKTE